MNRRSHLATLGLAAATPLAAAPLVGSPAAASPTNATLEFTAKRTKITLPKVPTLGLSYIALLDLFDNTDKKVGRASTSSFVVDLTTEGPIVLSTVVLHLADGAIHYQREIRRFGAYPYKSTGAVIGGTGQYSDAAGDVDVTWPDAELVEIVVHLS